MHNNKAVITSKKPEIIISKITKSELPVAKISPITDPINRIHRPIKNDENTTVFFININLLPIILYHNKKNPNGFF